MIYSNLFVEKKITTKTVQELYKWQAAKKIYVDHRFQRNACWKSQEKRGFIESLARGRAANPMHMADLKSCEVWCKTRGLESEAIKFSQVRSEASLPHKVSLDGQNRAIALQEFIENKFSASVVLDSPGRFYFKQLTEQQQGEFLNILFSIGIVTGSTYSGLADIFVDVNGGLPLNRMELRNALNTPMSEFVRDEAESREFLKNIQSVNSNRMKDRDTVLKIVCHVHSSQSKENFNDNCLDKFYESGIGAPDLGFYGKSFEADALKILDFVEKMVNNHPSKKNVELPHLWAICSAYKMLPELPFSDALSEADLAKSIFEAHNGLDIESSAQYNNDRVKAIKNSEPEPSKASYYFFAATDVTNKGKRDVVEKQLRIKLNRTIRVAYTEMKVPTTSAA